MVLKNLRRPLRTWRLPRKICSIEALRADGGASDRWAVQRAVIPLGTTMPSPKRLWPGSFVAIGPELRSTGKVTSCSRGAVENKGRQLRSTMQLQMTILWTAPERDRGRRDLCLCLCPYLYLYQGSVDVLKGPGARSHQAHVTENYVD
jgi:hypothetical protein